MRQLIPNDAAISLFDLPRCIKRIITRWREVSWRSNDLRVRSASETRRAGFFLVAVSTAA